MLDKLLAGGKSGVGSKLFAPVRVVAMDFPADC